MTSHVFQVLGIAGLKEPTPADVFADLPAADPGYRAVGGASDAVDVSDVLEALHQEFRQVLADPWQLVGRAQGHSGPAYPQWRDPGADVDTSAAASAESAQSVHLLETVLPRESLDGFIARFIAGLDGGEDSTLLLETRPEEVLQLFAPALAAGRHAPLPLTTRRDHHALSPDSAVHIGAFAAALAPPALLVPLAPIPEQPTYSQDRTT